MDFSFKVCELIDLAKLRVHKTEYYMWPGCGKGDGESTSEMASTGWEPFTECWREKGAPKSGSDVGQSLEKPQLHFYVPGVSKYITQGVLYVKNWAKESIHAASLSGFDEGVEGRPHIGNDFAPAVPSQGYLDPQILFSNSHFPPQIVVLGHLPFNRPPHLPQKGMNHRASEDSTLWVSSPIWSGIGGLQWVFYQI